MRPRSCVRLPADAKGIDIVGIRGYGVDTHSLDSDRRSTDLTVDRTALAAGWFITPYMLTKVDTSARNSPASRRRTSATAVNSAGSWFRGQSRSRRSK